MKALNASLAHNAIERAELLQWPLLATINEIYMAFTIELLLFIALIIGLFWLGLRLVYIRYIKTYSNEIEAYLNNQNLTFRLKRKVRRTDWMESPFKKPSSIRMNATIKIGGMMLPMNDEKFLIIETNENVVVWLKIESGLLSKPKLTFRQYSKTKPARSAKEIGNQKRFNCPACNYEIVEQDKSCPDCGLRLQ